MSFEARYPQQLFTQMSILAYYNIRAINTEFHNYSASVGIELL